MFLKYHKLFKFDLITIFCKPQDVQLIENKHAKYLAENSDFTIWLPIYGFNASFVSRQSFENCHKYAKNLADKLEFL